MTGAMFTIGQTVRWCDELTRGWYEGRAADGVAYVPAGIGRITEIIQDGYCGLCDHHGRDCPGPWYVADIEPTGIGSYGEHELQAA
jgi:hypothetical protein